MSINVLITTTELLKKFCSQIKQEKMIAIDTEFSRDSTYYPKLCLIQVASAQHTAAIDVISSDIDLSPLISILKDDNIIKIFHSAKQDLESLLVFFNFLPNNIFDSQIAASFCGYGTSIRYEFLVNELFSYKVDKSLRVSDWTHRPLSFEQINYALTDVTFILKIYDHLYQKLIDNNRLSWAIEDMRNLNRIENFDKDNDKAWQKIKYNHDLKIDLVIKRLASWRELKAQEHNLPRNHFLSEKNLVKLAKIKPINLEELNSIEVFRNFNSQEAEEIIEVILKALEEQLINDTQNHKEKSHNNSHDYQKLKHLLLICAKNHDIPAEMIASKQELKDFISDGKAKFLKGWRNEIFGKQIKKFLD